jgi:hypothetical protein
MQLKGCMKVVGRRQDPSPTLENIRALQLSLHELRGTHPFLPRGVYRFKSHQEADAWQMKMLTR